MSGLRSARGQASILVVGGLIGLIVAGLVAGAVARAVGREAGAQRAADLAAIAGARVMHDNYGRLFEPASIARRPNPRHLEKAAYLALGREAAAQVAEVNGAPAAAVTFPDEASMAPIRIHVAVTDRIHLRRGRARRTVAVTAQAEAQLGVSLDTAFAAGGGYDGPLAYRQGKPMRPDVAAAFDRLSAAASADGVTLLIDSGYRSDAEQAVLWRRHPDPKWVAPPGTSLHRYGTELDLAPKSAYGWLAAHAPAFHFIERYAWEPWHHGFRVPCLGMATWAGIIRVSHMGRRKEGADDFHADRDQLAQIERAVPPGDALELLPVEFNVSGGLPLEQRPSLLAAVEGVEGGQYAGIIVGYLSRLGRNVREQLRTYDRVHAAGGRIIVAQEGIDARTRGGRLQRNILAAIHEDEREQHVERFDNLRRWATEAGIWQRRQTPRGYRRHPETRRLVPDGHADEVRWAFQARATRSAPLVEIAERLRMTPSGVRHLLRNRAYLGELRVGDYSNPHAHPALVDHATFEAAQRDVARPSRTSGPPALLAGLVRCAACGHVMTRSGSRALPVYTCPRRHSGARCPGPAAVTVAILDAHVERIVLAELARLSVTAGRDRGLEQAQQRVAAAEAELSAYVAAVSAADIGAAAFAAGARQRRTELDAAREEMRAQLAREPAVGAEGSGADAWATLDGYERNTLLRGLLRAVIVARAGGRGSRTPIAERVRVLAYDSDIGLPRRRVPERPLGLHPLALPDFDHPGVLRLAAGEDGP